MQMNARTASNSVFAYPKRHSGKNNRELVGADEFSRFVYVGIQSSIVRRRKSLSSSELIHCPTLGGIVGR
jgi:hypothetical protein